VVYYWKVESDDAPEEDPRSLQINETKGGCTVQGKASSSTAPNYTHPLRIKKHNIGTEEMPKMTIIGD
jgi:hypothetical protein